jgi:hypothetical protein
VRFTDCGLVTAPSVKVSAPVTAPAAVGANATPTLQLAPAAIPVPHVLLTILKGALASIFEKLSAVLPLFVTLTVFVVLVLPAVTLPKFKVLAENVTGKMPLPVRFTACGPFAASSVNVSVPVPVPAEVGENVTPVVQVAPAAMLPTQVLLLIPKGPLEVTLVKFRAMFWRFVKVTVLAALVVPTTAPLKLSVLEERVTGALPVPERLTV